MSYKISNFMIAMLLVTLFTVVIGFTVADFSTSYDVAFNESQLSAYNKSQAIIDTTEQIRNKTTEINTEPGITDILGAYFGGAYDAIRLAIQSFDLFEDLSRSGAEDAGLHPIFATIIIAIVLIIVLVGILISTLVKRES